jgi:ABC-type sulfate transport system substrate-binding protein
MDKSANDSFKNFASGNGDVALVYENQLLTDKAAGGDDTEVVPPSTVLIQTPTVVVDKNAAQHCVLPIANAFVSYLHTSDAQAIFASVGNFRPVEPAEAVKANKDLGQPALADAFTTEDIGGWDKLLSDTVFGPSGAFTQALQAAKG